MEAAYFGDIEYLIDESSKFGGWENFYKKKEKYSFEIIVQNAINGEQVELLKQLTEPWWYSWSISLYFKNKRMTPQCADVFLKAFSNVPKWKIEALNFSIMTQNTPVMEHLLSEGVKPDPTTLASALLVQDYSLVGQLIKAGANPYQSLHGNSLIQQAIMMKSSSLIKLLDPEGKYREQLNQIQTEVGSRNGSKYLGWWSYDKSGFGSSSFNLNEDGTGVLYTDVGGQSLIWSEDNNILLFKFIRFGNYIKVQEMKLIFENGLFYPEKRDKNSHLAWKQVKEQKRIVDLGLEPLYLKPEGAYLTKDFQELYVLMNGRYGKVTLRDLFQQANQERGVDANQSNVIYWAEFKPTPMTKNIIEKCHFIPYVNENASLAYKGKGMLMKSHEEKAILKDGYEFTLYYTEGSTKKYEGVDPQKFTILSKNNLPNQLKVFEYYFIKDKLTREY
jgi:hypothetical protein